MKIVDHNDDWEGSNDMIIVQSDNKGNVVHRTADINWFDSLSSATEFNRSS